METNNNKQQLLQQQIQEFVGLRLRNRDSRVVDSFVDEEMAHRGPQLDSCHPPGTFAPSGLTGHLRPLLARRDRGPLARGIEQLGQSNRQTIDQTILRKEKLQHELLSDKELELHRLYQSQQQEKDRNQLLKAQVQKDIELQLTKARQELELQRRENAALERDLMQRRDAYQDISLQRLEEQHRKVIKKSFQSHFDEENCKTPLVRAGSERSQGQQPGQDTEQVQNQPGNSSLKHFQRPDGSFVHDSRQLDEVLSPRQLKSVREQRSESAPGTQQPTQLLAMHKLEALRQQAEWTTEIASMSDPGERLAHGERKTKNRCSARLGDSEYEGATRRSKNMQESQRDQQIQHRESLLNPARPRNDWRAHEIGDACQNQSSLAQMTETASVSRSVAGMEENFGSLENDTDGVNIRQVGRPLRGRTDSERLNYQRDTGDNSRQLQRQRDHRYSSFQEQAAKASDRAQKLFHHRLGSVTGNYALLQPEDGQFRKLRPRSCERIDSRSRHPSTLLMSSSSGGPPGLRLDGLLGRQATEPERSAPDYPVRSAMEIDASFTSEEDSDNDEETIARRKRLVKVPHRNVVNDNLPSSPSDDDAKADERPRKGDRRNSRRSSLPDADKVGQIPRASIDDGDDKANGVPDSQKRQSERLSERVQGVPKSIPSAPIGKEDLKASADEGQPRRQHENPSEKQQEAVEPEHSSSEESDIEERGQRRPDPGKTETRKSSDNGGATRRLSAGKVAAEALPEEWSGLPRTAQYPSRSDETTEETVANQRTGQDKIKQRLPLRTFPDSDDEDTAEDKLNRRGSKQSIASRMSRHAEPPTDDEEDDPRNSAGPAIKAGFDDKGASDLRRRHSVKSIQPADSAAATVNGGRNADSRFQNAAKQHGQPAQPQSNSKAAAELPLGDDSEVRPALQERSLNTSMKLGMAGEQTGLQQRVQEEEPQAPLAIQRNSWRSKHNKEAPDSYTQDSEHTRDTDSDTRSTIPNQGSYALRPESGGKVQLLARRFLQHKDQQKEPMTPDSESTRKEASKRSQPPEASKPGAASASKTRDGKPAASLFEGKSLVKSVSRMPAVEGAPTQVKPEDSLSEEDLEACKSRAQRKNEERRKRRQNKDEHDEAPVGLASDDEDDDVAPVMQQESMGEQLNRPHKEPDNSEVAPVTGDTHPEHKQRKPKQEQQAAKPRAPKLPAKPKEAVAVRALQVAPERPHRRRKRRSSRAEHLGRSVSLPPQLTVIYCCPPPCPPVNTCSVSCAVPSCYPTANYCRVGCRRC